MNISSFKFLSKFTLKSKPKQYLADNDECFVYLSSCIGKAELPSAAVKTIKNGSASMQNIKINLKPSEMIAELGLNKPVFASLCKNGLV